EIPVPDPQEPAYGGRKGDAAVSRMAYQRQRGSQTSQAAMNTILAALERGFSINDACRAAQRSRSAYQYYRDNFPEWRDRVDIILAQKTNDLAAVRENMPSFEEFCREYLDTEMNWHHKQWFDLIEGRDPA